jgi:hypothetical protein
MLIAPSARSEPAADVIALLGERGEGVDFGRSAMGSEIWVSGWRARSGRTASGLKPLCVSLRARKGAQNAAHDDK